MLREAPAAMMYPFLAWLEATGLSAWIRESPSMFAFPAILSLHTIGMGLVAGISAVVDLRVLGWAPGVPLSSMRRFFPVLWFGFWLNAGSGVMLFIAYPTKAVTNPVFYMKLLFIAAAMGILKVMTPRLSLLANQEKSASRLRALAAASLVCWVTVITAGRLLAYTYVRLMTLDV